MVEIVDIYHVWADKEGDVSDEEWVRSMRGFLDTLVRENRMEGYRITRCKLGFRSMPDLPEWHIMMEFTGMAQMDEAFRRVAPREGELEELHGGFNRYVSGNTHHALYRDWPDGH
jgi:hypothetical protein